MFEKMIGEDFHDTIIVTGNTLRQIPSEVCVRVKINTKGARTPFSAGTEVKSSCTWQFGNPPIIFLSCMPAQKWIESHNTAAQFPY